LTTTNADMVALVDLGRLREYLDPVVALVPGDLQLEVLSGGRSNITYLLRAGPDEYVLRRRPLGAIAAGAHDMAREYRVQAALQPTDIPLARVYGYCADETIMGAPFYVMSRVRGSVYHQRADVASLSSEAAAAISVEAVDVLDRLHRVDVAAVGLGELGRPEGFVRRRIGRWLDQWRNSPHREHGLVEPLGERLAAAVPPQADSTLVHGDYRLGNMLVEPVAAQPIAAVLDWEMSTLGDPMTDLAHLLVYWDRTRGRLTHESQAIAEHPGFLSSTELASRYAARSGRDLSDLPFYLAFEHWRAAIIKEGIYTRGRNGGQPDPEVDAIGDTVVRHLEEAEQILREG
jgi:aminoglycoside phosphotransferase (APT) family kinase protein